jgi:hypothetical protein
MKHPLEAIPQGKRLVVFLALLAVFLVMSVGFQFVGPAKPGIVDFQLAGTTCRATAITNAWDMQDRIRAGFNLGLDYLYMPVYSTLIALVCVWGAGVLASRQWRAIGLLLGWGLWAAALFDAVENAMLTVMLFDTVAAPYPLVAWVCAILKFGLIVLGLVFVAMAVVVYLVRRQAHKR